MTHQRESNATKPAAKNKGRGNAFSPATVAALTERSELVLAEGCTFLAAAPPLLAVLAGSACPLRLFSCATLELLPEELGTACAASRLVLALLLGSFEEREFPAAAFVTAASDASRLESEILGSRLAARTRFVTMTAGDFERAMLRPFPLSGEARGADVSKPR